jgi:hypothetical protein
MKYHSVGLFSRAVLFGLVYLSTVNTHSLPYNAGVSGTERKEMNSQCLPDDQILTSLRLISSAQTSSQQQSAQRQLIDDARKSSECRSRIIKTLVRAMDESTTDLSRDRSRFYLWHYGSEILAILKAEEALDFLIEHFDLHDGTLFPLNHHPAVVNVISMGSIALPKLEAVLRQTQNPNSRHYAVFCIASIGGSDAKRILSEALPSESNECVKSFITASLNALDSSSQIAPERRTNWYAAFLCDTPK